MPERFVGRTFGRYRVESLLGEGGFAWVYQASDPDLGISVALKVLKPQFAGDAEAQARFRREASTAARLRHPNIIKIYAVGSAEGTVYFAMDLYGSRLSRQLEVMGALSERGVIHLGVDIANALRYAHRQGVVHRDIKADNILFDEHGSAIVADFGIARALDSPAGGSTGTNVILGTPHYFAPEQARGRGTDARTDIYSLGVTLFQSATGTLPFTGDDWYEIATKHVEAPVPDPRSRNPELTEQVAAVIVRCLQKNPADRYQSAEELGEALRGAGAGASVTPDQTLLVPGSAFTTRTGARKLHPVLVLAAAILPVAAAMATFLWVEGRSPSPRRLTELLAAGANPHSLEFPSTLATDSMAVAGVAAAVADSAAADASGGGSRVGAPPATPPPRGAVTLNAPDGARLTFNGVAVGLGSWRSDTIPPGSYRALAVIPSGAGCGWARDSIVVVVRGGAAAQATLQPRECGTLMLSVTRGDNEPADATFSVRTPAGEQLADGRTPLGAPLVLPSGSVTLTVSAPYCSNWSDTVQISPNASTSRTVRLICGEARAPAQ